uniref:Phosphatidylinositol-glycan biosynthesis class X protein n=1 Tax=Canis lupus familiaris TaxID=9615 RepID=A0A8P0SHM0_CANLF
SEFPRRRAEPQVPGGGGGKLPGRLAGRRRRSRPAPRPRVTVRVPAPPVVPTATAQASATARAPALAPPPAGSRGAGRRANAAGLPAPRSPGPPQVPGLREAADARAVGARRRLPSRSLATRRRALGAARAGSSGRISSPRAPWGSAFCGVLAARAVGVQAVAWLLLCEAAGLSGTPAAPAGAGKKATCSEIILRQEVLKDGFHRDLLIKVKFGESIEDLQTCRLLIKQYIPTGLLVDPYELASLQESNITEAVMVSEDFNIEAPNYLSKESEVLIYARQDSQCIDCFQAFLPVHYRYHRPHSKDGETFIVVNNPDLLMYCDQELPILKCWAQSQVAAPCTLKNKDICQWNNMKYKSVFKNVTLQVPVGLTIHTSLVCSVTLLITILCSTLILLAIFKYGHFSL